MAWEPFIEMGVIEIIYSEITKAPHGERDQPDKEQLISISDYNMGFQINLSLSLIDVIIGVM